MLIKCNHVADFFLSRVDEDAGDLMPTAKLHKLLYYAQGYHLAIFEGPFFPESIMAWRNGPIVPGLCRYYTKKKPDFFDDPFPILLPTLVGFDETIFSPQQLNLLNEVHKVYGQYSGWKLRELTHGELPWTEAYNRDNHEISLEVLRDFFKPLVRATSIARVA